MFLKELPKGLSVVSIIQKLHLTTCHQLLIVQTQIKVTKMNLQDDTKTLSQIFSS